MNNRNYATTSSLNTKCMFRRDYSYATNHKCLDCSFCYRHTGETKVRYRQSDLLTLEYKAFKDMFNIPITVSRYCDPLYSEKTIKHSINAMNIIFSNGGQVIFRSAVDCFPKQMRALFLSNKDNLQIQPRFFVAPSSVGDLIRRELCPKFADPEFMIKQAKMCFDFGYDVAVYFDPLIIGINEVDITSLSKVFMDLGINKFIVRQLFATDKFKNALTLYIGKRYSDLLNQKVGEFWTYDSLVLLEKLVNIFNDNANISVCGNHSLNSLLSKHSNCCQFDKANAVYKYRF